MLVFRGFGAPGKRSCGSFSAENGPEGPGIGGGALNKLFANCINFALLATMLIPVTVMIRTVIVTAVTVVMMLMMVTAGVRIIL